MKIAYQLAVITLKMKQIIHWNSFLDFFLKAGRMSMLPLTARISLETANYL